MQLKPVTPPQACSTELPSASPGSHEGTAPKTGNHDSRTPSICLVLIAVTLAAYSPLLWNGFIDFDDDMYLTENPEISQGLTWDSVRFAFTTFLGGNWMPVTWLSYLLDISLFGLSARAIHAVNLLLHCVNSCLLFVVFRRMTGACWRSALVAALFSLHPLHVESVAWAAERKDVLSLFWGFVALLFYERYAARPRTSFYLGLLISDLLGLMSKPMLVTLPILLVLLDFWPLQRFERRALAGEGHGRYPTRSGAFLIVEKLPLLGLSLIFGVLTIVAQYQAQSISPMTILPLWARFANAAIAVTFYVQKTFVPLGLCGYYAHPLHQVDGFQSLSAALALGAFTGIVCILGKRGKPWLAMGWLWFLLALLPVCGVLQVGSQAYADRYSYLPQIGILVMLVWSAASCTWARRKRIGLIALVISVLIAEGVLTARQVTFWKDSATFWARTARFNPTSAVINNHLRRGHSRTALPSREAPQGF
jgi:hypothetical protein